MTVVPVNTRPLGKVLGPYSSILLFTVLIHIRFNQLRNDKAITFWYNYKCRDFIFHPHFESPQSHCSATYLLAGNHLIAISGSLFSTHSSLRLTKYFSAGKCHHETLSPMAQDHFCLTHHNIVNS